MTHFNHFKCADPTDIYEMVDTPWGHIPAWKASTLATGTMGAYDEYMKQIRADAAEAQTKIADIEQRGAALSAREALLQDAALKLVDFAGRIATLFDRYEQKRADAARVEQEEPPEHPPGEPPGEELSRDAPPGDPGNKLPDPSLSLEELGAVAPDEDPSGEFLRLKSPIDEAEFPEPEDKLPVPPVAQSIAAQFDDGE